MDYRCRAPTTSRVRGRDDGNALPVQPARHQGLRRGGRDRVAPGRHQRHHGRARPRGHRHAGDAAGRVARGPASPHEAGGRVERADRSTAMYDFTYHRPASLTRLGPARGQSRRQADGRRPDAAADHEAAAREPVRPRRPRRPARSVRHQRRGRRVDIGAMTRHGEVATSDVVQRAIPALAGMAAIVGDPAVRSRGTMGGSLANNDPAADYPAACPRARRHDRDRPREIAAEDYLPRPVRDRARGGRDASRRSFPNPGAPATRSSATRRRATPWSGCSWPRRAEGSPGDGHGGRASGVFRVPAMEAALRGASTPRLEG